jgi:hypothetical protein
MARRSLPAATAITDDIVAAGGAALVNRRAPATFAGAEGEFFIRRPAPESRSLFLAVVPSCSVISKIP